MPKRVVDGLGVWRSDKLRRVEPVWIRAEFANLIPLALANGAFECEPERVWADVYSYNRPDIQIAQVVTILDSFQAAKLLFRWQVGDKIWGYWVGIEKPGRLPGKSRRGKNELAGPEPPESELKAFLENTDANGIQKLLGFGFGFGFGSGSGSGKNICADKNGLHDRVAPLLNPKPSAETEALDRIWIYYLQKTEHNPKLYEFTAVRKQKGALRLRECLSKASGNLEKAEALMKIAVDNLTASTWHMGANPSKRKYDSWEKNLFKSKEQLDDWLSQISEVAS